MADDIAQKITEFTELAKGAPDTLLVVVDDPDNPGKKTRKFGFGTFLRTYNRSASEISANLSNDDLDFSEDPGHVPRYGENTIPGTTDMTTAIQNAINGAPVGGFVYARADEYICSGVTINKPLRFYGDANDDVLTTVVDYQGGTMLRAKTGGNDYVLTINRDSIISRQQQLYGIFIHNITLDGNSRLDMGGMKLSRIDHARFYKLQIQNVAREAINLNDEIRECSFTDIHMRWCGGENFPIVNLTENGTIDAHNLLKFTRCMTIFGLGDGYLFEDNVGLSGPQAAVREIMFTNCIHHGTIAAQDGSGNNPFNITFSAAEKATIPFNIKGGQNIRITATDILQAGIAVPAINMEDSINGVSPTVWYDGGYITSHYGAGANQFGCHIQTGEFSCQGVHWENHLDGVVRAESGATLRWGFGNKRGIGGTAPSIDVGATAEQDMFGDVDWNDHTFKKVGEAQVRILTSRLTNESLLIESQRDSNANAINIRTKNGSGVLTTRVAFGAGSGVQPIDFNGSMIVHQNFADGTRPTASNQNAGTQIWNTTDNAPNYSDGTNWRSVAVADFEVVTTTNVITAAESGTTFFLNTAGGFTSTLPAPALGLKYKFIVTTAPTTAYIITTNSSANILFGTFLDIVGELVYFSAQDTLNFVASTSVVGDFLEVESDATNWYCVAKSGADGGITAAVT